MEPVVAPVSAAEARRRRILARGQSRLDTITNMISKQDGDKESDKLGMFVIMGEMCIG